MKASIERTDSVLVAVEAAIVESSIRIAHTEGKRRTGAIGKIVIDKVEIVRPEVGVAKRSSWRYWVAIRSTASGARVESGSNGQSTRVQVVICSSGRSASSIVPDDIDQVLGVVVRVRSLPKQRDWTRSSHIDLLGIVAGQDEDCVSISIVWQAQDGGLDGGKGRSGSDQQCSCWAALERVSSGYLTVASVVC